MKRIHLPCQLSLGAAAVLAALSAHAQQAPAPKAEDKTQTVEIKGTAANYDPRRDDTASKIVLSHEEIIKYGDSQVSDVLKRLPGITVSSGPGRLGGEIRMRGLGNGYTQILINGERAPIGFSIDSIAPDVIERIEVQRAASAEFSTQAVAGTINIVLKRAISTQQREIKPGFFGGRGLWALGTNVQLSDKLGKMSYSLAIQGGHQEIDRDNPSEEIGTNPNGSPAIRRTTASRERNHNNGVFMVPRLNWTLDNGDALVSQNFVATNRARSNVHAVTNTAVGPAYLTPILDSGTVNSFDLLRSDLNWTHKTDGGGKLDAKIGINYTHNDSESRQLGRPFPGNTLSLDRFSNVYGSERGTSTTGKYLSGAFDGHSLAFGWDGAYSRRADENLQHDTPLMFAPPPLNINDASEATLERFAMFVQDEWNVLPTWSVYLGVRWEGIELRSSGNSFAPIDNTFGVWSPIFQTLYKFPESKGDQLRLALTRTFKAPQTQNLIPRVTPSANNSPVEPDRAGNPNLKPELALGVDASYEHYWPNGAMVSAAASTRRIRDYTRSALDQDPHGRWVIHPVNDGTANTHSLELEVKFPLRSVFESAPALDMRANVARNWSRVESVPGPNNRLDQQTPLSSTLGVDYKEGALTAGGSLTFRNGGLVRISNRQYGYSSVRRDLDLYALIKTSPKTQWRLALANALQQDLSNATIVSDDHLTDTRTSIAPGHATLRGTYEVKF